MDASRDKKVFVHCAANYRVSSFVALYGEARLGWSRSRATRTSADLGAERDWSASSRGGTWHRR
jgi:hypothetical protein